MKHLIEYVKEQLNNYIIEGGQAGHMAHVIDYEDFTCNDLIELINDLFSGKVEHMKEKLDGMNISASVNSDGKTVFVRNDKEQQNKNGGVLLDELDERWAGKEHQKEVFTKCGKVIDTIFQKLGKEYFNPAPDVRKYINCECIVIGKADITNIMPYYSDRVAFHGYKLYKRGIINSGQFAGQEGWIDIEDHEGGVEEIYKAAEGIDEAKPRPDLVIKAAIDANKIAEEFNKDLNKIFTAEGLNVNNTIDDYKFARYKKLAPDWCNEDIDIYSKVLGRKGTINVNLLKKRYPEHKDELTADGIKKLTKDLKYSLSEPLDNLFLKIGNKLINCLGGFTNADSHNKVVDRLKADMTDVVNAVKNSDNQDALDTIDKQLKRLQMLDNQFNSAEGIVLMYKGRRMKLTGSFAAINAILGTRFKLEKK